MRVCVPANERNCGCICKTGCWNRSGCITQQRLRAIEKRRACSAAALQIHLTQQAGGRWTRAQSGLLVQIRGFRSPPKAKLNQRVIQGLWPDRIHESNSSEQPALVPAELDFQNSSARGMEARASRQESCLRRDFRCGHSSKTMNRSPVCHCGTDSCHTMRMPLTTKPTPQRSSQTPSKHAAATASDVVRLALLWHELRHQTT